MTVDSQAEWVGLTSRFTPGWPWPTDSWGLDPMYGPDGWCRACGTPLAPQMGHLTIQGAGFPTARVWTPNWHFDAVCITADVAHEVRNRFSVQLRDVHKPRKGQTGVMQLLPEVSPIAWYDPADLASAVVARHERYSGAQSGATCTACQRWRWLPILVGEAPIRPDALDAETDVICSPEYFGDGCMSFRHVLFRTALADLLVQANPRTWSKIEIPTA